MPKRRQILLVLVGGALAIGLYAIISGPPEPSYKGRSLSAWMDNYKPLIPYKPEVEERRYREANEALKAMGTNALPHLLKWIQYEDSKWKMIIGEAVRSNRKYGLMVWNWAQADSTWATCSKIAIANLGTETTPAVPELVRLTSDARRPEIASRAKWILLHAETPEGLSAAIAAVKNDEPSIRLGVIAKISGLGANATSAIPALLTCVSDSNYEVRLFAAAVLSQIAPQTLTNAPPK